MAKLFDEMGIAVIALVDSEGIVSNYDMRNMMDIFDSTHSDEALDQAFDIAWRSDDIKTIDDFERVLDQEEAWLKAQRENEQY